MDKRINLALIGFGSFGKLYFKTIKKNKKFNLVSIFRKKKIDNSKFKILSKKNIISSRIEAAIVCTPVETHYKISKLLIENKIPIILEKPAAKNITEIKKLIKISKKNKTSVLVNHSDLYNENLKFFYLNKKLIGKICFVQANFGKFSLKYRNKMFSPFKDWCPHIFALILKFVKNIYFLEVISNKVFKKNGFFFQDLSLYFKAKDNIRGIVNFSNLPKNKDRKLALFGTKGKIEYDGYNEKNNYLSADKKISLKKTEFSPMENILNKLHYLTKKRLYYSDLETSLEIEKILIKIEKNKKI